MGAIPQSMNYHRLILILALMVLPSEAFSRDQSPRAEEFTRAKLRVLNGTADPVKLYWLKAGRERVLTSQIKGHGHADISTTVGHEFVVGSNGKHEVNSREICQDCVKASKPPCKTLFAHSRAPEACPCRWRWYRCW